MALARLDHVIYRVPDIEALHARLTATYPEAWPIGRFWPDGRTSGIAIGGLNLELIQPDEPAIDRPIGSTLVFEPTSWPEVTSAFARAGVAGREFEKFESDPELLRLRGFEDTGRQQLVCRNYLPEDPAALPFDFFICDYSPFLKIHLSPHSRRLEGPPDVTEIVYGTPQPDEARQLLDHLGYEGSIPIYFEPRTVRSILAIRTTFGEISL